jgi:chromosome segregation ATPase
MISLSQIQLLEQKIESAIIKIAALTDENNKLHAQYDSARAENTSLQNKLNEFQSNQSRIEQGILNALHRLETVENTIIETVKEPESPRTVQSTTQSVPPEAPLSAAPASQASVPADAPLPSDAEPVSPQFDIF